MFINSRRPDGVWQAPEQPHAMRDRFPLWYSLDRHGGLCCLAPRVRNVLHEDDDSAEDHRSIEQCRVHRLRIVRWALSNFGAALCPFAAKPIKNFANSRIEEASRESHE